MGAKNKITRFRAYQLGSAGSSFSYFNGVEFTLIEARFNQLNSVNIKDEMKLCSVSKISTLHITSWDQDHCVPSQLEQIIDELKPNKIEYPGYKPHTTCGCDSLQIIEKFKKNKRAVKISPDYISSLNKSESYGYKDVLLHPKYLSKDSANDNSTVKLFRSGSFNVLSLGDVESVQISSGLKTYGSIKNEIDIMILAHHGADNGFTTSSFLKTVRPKVGIATADYANQFKHPKQNIRDLLHKNEIKLFTTKTGDVVIYSIGSHSGKYKVINLMTGSTKISSSYEFSAKKMKYLSVNQDTLRARIHKGVRDPKR
jgi:competence protein ComEC